MRFYRLIGLLSLPLAAIAQAQDTQTEDATEASVEVVPAPPAEPVEDGEASDGVPMEEGAEGPAEAAVEATVEESAQVGDTAAEMADDVATGEEATAVDAAEVAAEAAAEEAPAEEAPGEEPVSDLYVFTDEEIAEVPLPELAFDSGDVNEKDFKKYFYFHRDDTDFSEAYADITECDQLSAGISYYAGGGEPYAGYYASQYGIGGAIGGAIGAAMADAIFGSSARRKIRRINIRNCMGFKGYQRYGLKKDLWKVFNFEEGNGRKRDDVREAALLQQARVASGPKPTAEDLGI